MLDELLGRAALKERIDDLAEERDRLQARLDAETERRRAAVTDRQAAEERANRLEDRIADLEGRLAHREGEAAAPEFRRVETLRGERLATVLDRFEHVETGPEGALTAVVDDDHDDLPPAVTDAFGDHAALVRRAAPCVALADDAGLVAAALTAPTRPPAGVTWADGFAVERSWFEPTGSFSLALVRSDLFAVGRYEGRERVDYAGFTSDVQGRHSKGGYSQARFERRRDDQVDDHLERAHAAIEERAPERCYVVGGAQAVRALDDLADATATVDATGDPEDALDDAFRQFWTVRCYGI